MRSGSAAIAKKKLDVCQTGARNGREGTWPTGGMTVGATPTSSRPRYGLPSSMVGRDLECYKKGDLDLMIREKHEPRYVVSYRDPEGFEHEVAGAFTWRYT